MKSTSFEGADFEGADDVVLPFAVEPLDVRGRVVRLGPSIDTILSRHGYPDLVARALGEAAALTVLLGSSLKFEGRFQLQTKSDGAIEMIVVDFDAPDRLRATARFDKDRIAALTAPQLVCPSTTIDFTPTTFTAYSRLPSSSSFTTLPAMRMPKRSPMP